MDKNMTYDRNAKLIKTRNVISENGDSDRIIETIVILIACLFLMLAIIL